MEERNKVRIKMLNRRTRMNTGNYKVRKGEPRKCVKQHPPPKRAYKFKVLKCMGKQIKEVKQENSVQNSRDGGRLLATDFYLLREG
jgi:hypothetical protein